DEEPVDFGFAHDGAVVWRDVTQARPGAQHLDRRQDREELEGVVRTLFEEADGRVLAVGRVGLDLGADQDLPAIGLADIDVAGGPRRADGRARPGWGTRDGR